MPLKCSSLERDDISDDALFRELYADAIERAVNNEKTAKDVPADSWADHPYYDDLETDRGDDEQVDVSPDDEQEIPWKDHPYYDDLGMSEIVQDDVDLGLTASDQCDEEQEEAGWDNHLNYDDLDSCETGLDAEVHLDGASEQDHQTDSACGTGLAWEDHPFYDAPDDESETPEGEHPEAPNEDHQTESDSCEDSACRTDLAWEDHPFYDAPFDESEAPEVDVAGQDHHSYATSEEDSDELAWEDSPYY
jgi:hypothetical protein